MQAKGCVFCGKTPLTLEHAVPAWCRDVLSIQGPLVTTRDIKDNDARSRDGWVQHGLDVKVRDVCADCNHGWMAALEYTAARILRPLVVSTTQKTRVEVDFLATWATKTVLTCSLQTGDVLILPSQFRWFYENQRPFPDSLGWYGAFDFGNPHSFSNSGTRLPGSGAWRATINVGALVLMIWVIPGDPPRNSQELWIASS